MSDYEDEHRKPGESETDYVLRLLKEIREMKEESDKYWKECGGIGNKPHHKGIGDK